MAWRLGPLPKNTWGWGGVVKAGQKEQGFYFADFCGSKVKIVPGGEILEPHEVGMFDNSLELPPKLHEGLGGGETRLGGG